MIWPVMWPCHKCGGRGRRNLGTQGWCEVHLGELYARFRLDAWMTADMHSDALRAAAHDRLLEVPEPANESTIAAWGDRLERAIEVHVVTRDEAARAWRQAVRSVAA